jgi:protein phosphatase/serine/threonine-protein phosphatase Stp1
MSDQADDDLTAQPGSLTAPPPPRIEPPALHSWSATHEGAVRPRNEDAFVDRPDLGLWAVADGAGGHGAGDVASAAIAEAMQAIPPGLTAAEILAQLRLRLAAVHAELQRKAQALGPHRLIASTVVALLARGEHYAALWAGDSRAYLLRGGRLAAITRDHSLVQELLEEGKITEAEAAHHPQGNVITRAVGATGVLELDKVSGRIAAGDRFLLCSDGLVRTLPEPEIAGLLAAEEPARRLVETAVERGARDNVTVVALARTG